MIFSTAHFRKAFKKAVTEIGSLKYDNWSFIVLKSKVVGVISQYFINNDFKNDIIKNPQLLQYIEFDSWGSPLSIRPTHTKTSLPKNLIQTKNLILKKVRKVAPGLPYWIIFKELFKIHLNKKGISQEEQMNAINEVYSRYCIEIKPI